ncbi:MAG TPA: hypothetical protein VMX17_01220 [Candidatus Glassbacteria bacterium]|nr:hypothetical protein [Candidatus Glassbacteria bacterium]
MKSTKQVLLEKDKSKWLHTNEGVVWTKEEENEVWNMAMMGEPVEYMAKYFHRSRDAITTKCQHIWEAYTIDNDGHYKEDLDRYSHVKSEMDRNGKWHKSKKMSNDKLRRGAEFADEACRCIMTSTKRRSSVIKRLAYASQLTGRSTKAIVGFMERNCEGKSLFDKKNVCPTCGQFLKGV